MVGIHENYFVVLVNTILVHPVGVQDPQVSTPLSNSLFCCASESTLELEVVDTLTDGLSECGTYDTAGEFAGRVT